MPNAIFENTDIVSKQEDAEKVKNEAHTDDDNECRQQRKWSSVSLQASNKSPHVPREQ